MFLTKLHRSKLFPLGILKKLCFFVVFMCVQEDWLDVAEEIDDLFLGDAEVDPTPVIDSGSILNLTNGNDCCPSHNSHVH